MRSLLVILVTFIGCKKEDTIPHLRFSNEEKQWLTYNTGQTFTFKNPQGEQLVYTVTKVEHNINTPEYKDPNDLSIVAYRETYLAKLASNNDSIILYFYKEQNYNASPDKLIQTIRWHRVKNQFVVLTALVTQPNFSSRTVNGINYSRVTQALPQSNTIYPFTQFDHAYYDQKAGFIELVDLNGISWIRQ